MGKPPVKTVGKKYDEKEALRKKNNSSNNNINTIMTAESQSIISIIFIKLCLQFPTLPQ